MQPAGTPNQIMLNTTTLQRAIVLAALAAVGLLCGCRSTPPPPAKFTFFPPAPNPPRIQYLGSFSAGADLRQKSGFMEYVTGKTPGPSPLVKPYGLALHKGWLRVCDTALGAIEVFDLVEKRSRYFTPRGEGRLSVPVNISIDADGTQYIADTGRDQVLIFSENEVYLGAIGLSDEMKPSDVAISADRLYVTDLKNHQVRVYSKADRKLLFSIPRDPKEPKGKLYSPTNLALDKEGHLIVSDLGAFAVQVYDRDGNFLRTIGQQGVAPGLFARPKGVAADREGRILVVDASVQVVQMFDAEGRLLMYFGQPGASDQGELYLPAAVKVDYDNLSLFESQVAPCYRLEYLILVTSQFGDHKVGIYGFIREK
jgi:hypothetical protein